MISSFYINNIKCDILHSFNYNNDTYIIYNDGSYDSNHQLNVLASKFIIKDNLMHLLPINNDEWNIVDKEWNKFNE